MRLFAFVVLSARAIRGTWLSAFDPTNDPRQLIREG